VNRRKPLQGKSANVGAPIPERKIDKKKGYRHNYKVHKERILPCFSQLERGCVESRLRAAGWGAYFLKKNGKNVLELQ